MTAAFASSFKFLLYNQLVGTVVNSIQQSIFLQFVSTEVLGLVNVQLALIPNVILTLTREPFRKTSPRFPGKEHSTKLAHVSLLLLPLGILVSIIQLLVSLLINPSWRTLGSVFGFSFFIYSVSALLELAFEPFYTQVSGNYTLRKDVDTKVLLLRSTLSLGVAYLYGRQPSKAILGFSFVQLVSSAYYFLKYRRAAPVKNIIGTWTEGREIRTIYWTFFWDTLTRFLLAQGDVILLSSFASPNTQGLYSLLTNYGSLVLRVIFTPLEESVRSFYSSKDASSDERIFEAVFVFAQCCSLALSLFACQYTVPLLASFVPSSSNIYKLMPLIPTYCHLMSFMILNGILEAYLHATLNVQSLAKLKSHTVLMTCIYFALAVIFLQSFPQTGVIYANLCNFGMRIALTVYYLRFKLPLVDPLSLFVAVTCGALCYFYELPLKHGFALGLITATTIIIRERKQMLNLKKILL